MNFLTHKFTKIFFTTILIWWYDISLSNMRFIYSFLFFSIAFPAFPQHSREHLKEFKIITDMMDSVSNLKYIRCNMRSLERVETGFTSAYTSIKIQVAPRKSYLVNREKKLEVLYNSEHSAHKCLVKPHVFPYFTLSLDPRGNLMRKNQHFTIFELGFDFVAKTIAIALSKEKDQVSKHLTLVGKVEKNKMNCYLFIYENNSFFYNDYTVQAKETVSSIASKFVVNDYMLRTKNNLYNDYGYLKQGSKIKVPAYYCKKALFYIDEKTMLPISVTLYDEVGLFETYDYMNIEVSKTIPANEFSKIFKGYGF